MRSLDEHVGLMAAADACVVCRRDKMFQTIRNFSELHASFHQEGHFSMLDGTEEPLLYA